MRRIKFVNTVARLLGLRGEYKKERPVLNVEIGNDWSPSPKDLEFLKERFFLADLDSTGAIITRQ